MMKRLLPYLILPACFLVFLSTATAVNDITCHQYLGDVSKETVIRMNLCDGGSTVTGYYFYKRWLKDIELRGEHTGQREIALKEYDEKGKVQGSFTLRYEDKDPRKHFGGNSKLDREVLTGKWTSADGSQSYPVYLYSTGSGFSDFGHGSYVEAGASDAALVERNAQGFYFAVLKGDRQGAAKFVGYPLIYNDQGSRKSARNQAEFLLAYDRIFTDKFVAKIAEGIPHHMFAKSTGIMLGNGEVWFDNQGKAHILNN